MNSFEKYLDVLPEIQQALDENKPVVALESTILSHGMPYPENLDFAHRVEEVIRSLGAIPATCAIVKGRLKVGLTAEELEIMCRAENIGKVSRRDVAVYVALGRTGATTVASTMIIAAMAGIPVFATGGIGGVHRGGQDSMDISADLQELAHTPVTVVCAGAKQILDIGRTLEYLETMGVPVIGNGTSDFPAFFCKKSASRSSHTSGSIFSTPNQSRSSASFMKSQTQRGVKTSPCRLVRLDCCSAAFRARVFTSEISASSISRPRPYASPSVS